MKAMDFIKRQREQTFFCFIASTLPHMELLVPEKSKAAYRGKLGTEVPMVSIYHNADCAEPKATLAGMISHLDAQVGGIMALLKETGIDEETIIFYTFDNGPEVEAKVGGLVNQFFKASGALRGEKETLSEGGIRVPMIARWPKRIKAGVVNDYVGYFPDFMPTFAEIGEAKAIVPGNIDGLSLLPALMGEEGSERERPHEKGLFWGSGKGVVIRSGL
jgi:arylsulfatase A-like enzyme